jgi:hypothetical protein
MYVEEGGRIDYLTRGTLAALYANWLIVACEKRPIDGRRHGTMYRHNVARARPPDA